MDVTTRKPDPIDIHVGGRMRLRRMVVRMSQEKLGEKMGLTFQQIQKYEKGQNRIGASRLAKLAYHLGVEVSYFFEDGPIPNALHLVNESRERSAESRLLDFLDSRDGLALNRAFVSITDAKLKKRIVEMVKAMAGHYEDDLEMEKAA